MAATITQERITGRGWAVLFVLCGAIFLEGIDVSMMGVALPSIRAELGLATGELQWIVSAYALGYGGFVLLGGRAADLLGRRRMFVGWLAIFLMFSGLGGFATEGWVLILARFVTGIAAAFMTPAGLSIITTTYTEGPQRDRALLVYAGTAAGGFSLGMVTGGLLSSIDWRWVFFAPVLVSAIVLAGALALIPRDVRTPGPRHGFDIIGTLTLTGAMMLLISTVVRAPDVARGQTVGTGIAGLAVLALFILIERRAKSPLVRLGILRNAGLVRANLGAILLVGSFVGFQFVAVLYLQELRHWSELETGLALMVIGIDSVLAPTLTPWLVKRFGNPRVVFGGFALATLAYAAFLPLKADWTYTAMLPAFILLGLAFALTYGPLTIAATDGVPENEQGLASGVLTTSFQFGSALGLAVVAAVLTATDVLTVDRFRAGLVVPLIAAVLGLLIAGRGLLVIARPREVSRTS
ncbi:MFS transporter [Kribbella solani]|uniref:MFS transporter n=1 Tax=Kribbella solani TaxID=236067 RepID=UPI0029A740AF|nr:MFS transporter [Kribbella solani]MDX2972448.1 MFS transporter [Kribbella solani]